MLPDVFDVILLSLLALFPFLPCDRHWRDEGFGEGRIQAEEECVRLGLVVCQTLF